MPTIIDIPLNTMVADLDSALRRMLERVRFIPSVREAVVALGGLDPGPKLIAAGRAAAARFSEVDLRPAPLCDTLVAWVAEEAVAYAPVDGLLVMLTFAPALVLLGAH